MRRYKFSFKAAMVLILTGLLLHYASLRWSELQSSSAEPSARLLDSPIVLFTYVLLGGILYGALLTWPVSQALYQTKISSVTLLKGGLFGMLATISALQGCYLTMGCLLTHLARTTYPVVRAGSISWTFIIIMIPIETYGLLEIFRFMVPAFLAGMLMTGLARLLHSRAALRKAGGGEDVLE
jgi:ABC-type thiamin/hydroxymethylpyrimidine transport system permease subunit